MIKPIIKRFWRKLKVKTPNKFRQMEFKNLLLELTVLLQPKSYLELGVKDGYTFNAIAPLVDKAYAVDFNQRKSVTINNNVEFFEMSTTNFYENFKTRNEKIDFIFVDADHKKESVIIDIAIAKEFITPFSGLIFIHDTYPIKEELMCQGYCHTAWEAIQITKPDIKAMHMELITIPGPWAGLSIMRYTPDNKHGWMDFKK